jgi:hypothetical protein
MSLAGPSRLSDWPMTVRAVQTQVVPQQTQQNEPRSGSVRVRKEAESGWQSDPGLDRPGDSRLLATEPRWPVVAGVSAVRAGLSARCLCTE